MNYLYADIHALFDIAGRPGAFEPLAPGFLMGSAVFMEIPATVAQACRHRRRPSSVPVAAAFDDSLLRFSPRLAICGNGMTLSNDLRSSNNGAMSAERAERIRSTVKLSSGWSR